MEVSAPAKINLFLKVIGRRDDGYHELVSLMCCVGLYDRIVLDFNTGLEGMTCSRSDLPCDHSNLVMKAVLIFHRALGRSNAAPPASVSIHLGKNIPIGAGLGGGSSDAAAVLKALNVHYGSPLTREDLLSLSLALGADVPFFIDGVPAVARGIGEKLCPYHGIPPMAIVLVFPGFGISTGQVFRNLNLRLTKCEKEIRNLPFINGDFVVPDHLDNDLESVVIKQYPIIGEIKRALMVQGAAGSMVTGSGSTVFGLFSNITEAQNAGRALCQNPDFQVFVTSLLC